MFFSFFLLAKVIAVEQQASKRSRKLEGREASRFYPSSDAKGQLAALQLLL
jgi:hypothetical protein